MSVSHFRELEVWQLAMVLVRHVYRATANFPSNERYGLTSQIQRSAISIPSNIAEGNARLSTRDYARFISISLGSVAELQTQLLLARDLGLGDEADFDETLALCERVGRMLLRLHHSLRRKLLSESPVPGPQSRVENDADLATE